MVRGNVRPRLERSEADKEMGDVIWSMRDIADEMPAEVRQAFSRQNMCAHSARSGCDRRGALSHCRPVPLPSCLAHCPAALLTAMAPPHLRHCRNQPQLNQLAIQAAIKTWQRFPGDTGSSEVQIAILTEEIKIMATHMETAKKDTYVANTCTHSCTASLLHSLAHLLTHPLTCPLTR